jgi:amino acid/amide ABC transporter membrane protein 1, HAAT family (TC 3.A.1.4.-)
MSMTDIFNITMMQGFAGLSLFSVLLLMGLGLAIIFGQMGVINMAHGEFMTIGAYTIYLASNLVEHHAPSLLKVYFPFAIVAAFVFAFIVGWLAEWALVGICTNARSTRCWRPGACRWRCSRRFVRCSARAK